MWEEPRTAFLIPGRREAAERAIRECAEQNGGRVVGNPTVQDDSTISVEGDTVTVVIIEDRADPRQWWRQWAKVHGWKRHPELSM